ncbi:MAG TPA: right-handed parallel beta-helix repeat-containing protein, partial [Kiloniellales bacterium]
KTDSLFEGVELTGARGGFFGVHQVSGGLSVYRSSVRIAHSRFQGLPANDGIHLSHAHFTLEDSVIEGTASDALDIDWSFGAITHSSFKRCGTDSGDCIDTSGSLIEMQYNQIVRALDKGVSVGEGSVVYIRDLQVTDSRIGVAVKDGAQVYLETCHLSQNEYGLLRYIKKPFYPYPELRTKHCDYVDNAVARTDEPQQIWTRRYD